MKLYKAYKLEIMILDDDYYEDAQDMLECVLEAIGIHCEVVKAVGKVLEEKKDIISNDVCDIAEA